MIVLLSPAKSMNESRTTALPLSEPRFASDTDGLVKIAEGLTAQDIRNLMKVSDDIANLNVRRYTDFASQPEHPAGLLFDGDVYWGLDAESLDDEGMRAADDRIRILSGLYGYLRPLDRVRPYRMEMGTKLANPRGNTLYNYWGSSIAKAIDADMEGREGAVLNLASNEYFKAVDRKALRSPVVSAKFLNIKDGVRKNLGFFAKRARGQMARFVVDNRIDRAEGAKDFNYDGYRFDAKQSSDTEYVFSRTQPPPAS